MAEPTITIDNIKVFTKNNVHKGDYFLITEDNLTFWVTDPKNLLREKDERIKSLSCALKVATVDNKNTQQLVIKEIVWVSSTEKVQKAPFEERPDYTGWTDEQIAVDILERKKHKERVQGNPFVKFRESVVISQGERHKQLISEIKSANRDGRKIQFKDIDIDDTYMQTLLKEQQSLENRLGRNAMIGDGQTRLDGSSNYDLNNDLTWGTPAHV